jgi:protein PhnA
VKIQISLRVLLAFYIVSTQIAIRIKMTNQHHCPKCHSENTYEDGAMWVCPECNHEWSPTAKDAVEAAVPADERVLDSNGNVLSNGDSVTLIKDLKVKGSASGLKSGTKVRNIRLVSSDDGHNISCKVDGIGAMYLKSEFVKKV